ncbi:hypothetical protein LWI29_017175 [Acer saccharum]|uniref:Uncharacterized protein n=1 Tax=Acer saccharum TaxID=4024 RepID=A0AA39VT61_ACESA|nr:hypothetical protein LWI29_017175 [Acer saccharum]
MTQYHIKGDQGDTIVFAGDGGMVSLPPHVPQIKVSGSNTLESAYIKAILFSKVGVDLSNVLGFPTDYLKPKDILKEEFGCGENVSANASNEMLSGSDQSGQQSHVSIFGGGDGYCSGDRFLGGKEREEVFQRKGSGFGQDRREEGNCVRREDHSYWKIGKVVISIGQKGKGKMEYVKKKPTVRYDPNAKLVLEKRKIYNKKGGFKEGFRTPSLDFEGVGISEFGKGKGESSHQKMGGLGGPKSNIIVDLGLISLLNGLKSSNLHLGQSFELSSGDKSGRKATTKLDSNHRGA